MLIATSAFVLDNGAVIKYDVSASNPTHNTLQRAYVITDS